MSFLQSFSKSMKGTFIGDIAKSADKALDATSSFIDGCIEDAVNEIADTADSISKELKSCKRCRKMGRVVSGYEAYDSRKKQKRPKSLLTGC